MAPGALDKLNVDFIVDEYADILGTPVEAVISSKQAQQTRQEKAEQQAQLMQQQAIPELANTAKTLSETEVDGGNALDQLAKQQG